MITDRLKEMPGFARLQTWFVAFGPVSTVFFGSVLLSLIALQKGTLNRDGMLYVETARVFMADGFDAALNTYNWPFLSLLMAGISQVTGLHPEVSGHALNTLFMAGACALLVSCSRRMFPDAGWFVGLVVLALPGLNGYRDELLREYGCWFFCMLAIWLMLRWSDRPSWSMALATQSALGVAALFRPEALTMFPALLFWQWFSAPKQERWQRLAMIGSLPAISFIALMALLATDHLNASRIVGDFHRLMPIQFANKTKALAGVLHEHGKGQATLILFFGSLAIIPVKFLGKMGIFVVPLFHAFVGQSVRRTLYRSGIFAWVFLAHLLVLGLFVLEMQFLAGRYVALLLLFSAPLTGYGLFRLIQRFPVWETYLVLLALLIMMSNVVTLAPSKSYFVEAGEWLSANAADTPRVYVESPRAAYYAGWRFAPRPSPKNRAKLSGGVSRNKYDLVVLEVSDHDANFPVWFASSGLREVIRFSHPDGGSVVIATPEYASGKAGNGRSSSH